MQTKKKTSQLKNQENKAFSHWDEKGETKMVDVGGKKTTSRLARARAILKPSALFPKNWEESFSKGNPWPKGNPWEVAKIAGMQAAKKTSTLIPLCHPLALNHIELKMHWKENQNLFFLECTVKTEAKTGAEMEALVGVSIAALTFYDMIKAVDPFCTVQTLGVYKKTGGKSGKWMNPALEWGDF